MRQHTSLVTIATPDLEATYRFYVDGLGWEPLLHVPGDVLFIQTNHGLVVSFFDGAAFNADLGRPGSAAPTGVSLALNVDSAEEVDTAIGEAVAAGATVLKAPTRAEWGGYHGYFADPCGLVWELAHNPTLQFGADGRVRFST